MRANHVIVSGIAVAALLCAPAASAAGSGSSPSASSAQSGGVGMGSGPVRSTSAQPEVQGYQAKIIHGVAYAPSYAPIQVKRAIWAGNQIRKKPYCYAGGHGKWNDSCYDCSGTVSYVLHAAGLLSESMDSSGFESWGRGGHGHWITVYTNPGHAFIQIAGIRLDTSAEQDPNPPPGSGPRWRPMVTDHSGFDLRHPNGL
jgi:hypothetical protein